MDRKETVLKHIDQAGHGIEIGPSYSPVAPKRDGYQVHIIDHMSRKELLEKYEGYPVDLDQIEEVDFVWRGEKYSELTGNSKYYDWIIASHVIEHTPDLIGFLNDCDAVLKDEGVLSLVIPDKRFCFDHFRPITGISKIIDSHLSGNIIQTAGTIAEYYLNVVVKSGVIAWDATAAGEYILIHSLEDAMQGMNKVLDDKIYIDAHSWCFIPHSFRLIIHDLYNLGLIPFQEVDYSPTAGCEFYITLGRGGQGIQKSRLEILKTIEDETGSGAGYQLPARLRGASRRMVDRFRRRLPQRGHPK